MSAEISHHTLPIGAPPCDRRKEGENGLRPQNPRFSARVTLPVKCVQFIESAKLKPLRRDKLLAFCADLLATGARTDTGAPVNLIFYRRLYAMRGRELINDLIYLQILEPEPYRREIPQVAAARWRFVGSIRRAGCRLSKVKLQTEKVSAWVSCKERRNQAAFAASRLPKRFMSDLETIIPDAHFFDVFDAYIGHLKSQEKATASMQTLRNVFRHPLRTLKVKHSRMTSAIALLPKQLRQRLLVNGEPSVELDLPSSHPAILASMFAPTERSSSEENLKWEQLVALIQRGEFYQALEGCWPADRWQFMRFAVGQKSKSYEKFVGDRADFLRNSPRKGIKLSFQILLNTPCNFRETNLFDELSTCLPHFTRRFVAYKESGADALGKELRRREARFIAELADASRQPVATLYDGILTNEEGAAQILEAAPRISIKHLGFHHLPVAK